MNNSLINQGVTKECVEYCMKSIVRLLNGDTKKFEEYAAKALEINNKEKEESNWTSVEKCKFNKLDSCYGKLCGECIDYEQCPLRCDSNCDECPGKVKIIKRRN